VRQSIELDGQTFNTRHLLIFGHFASVKKSRALSMAIHSEAPPSVNLQKRTADATTIAYSMQDIRHVKSRIQFIGDAAHFHRDGNARHRRGIGKTFCDADQLQRDV
jgi:hypothetical protein